MQKVSLALIVALCGLAIAYAASVTYTGSNAVRNNWSNEFSAFTGGAGNSVTFKFGDGSHHQSCTATSDASGVAACSFTVNQHLGWTNSLTMNGAPLHVVVFAFPSESGHDEDDDGHSGAFVIGDVTASHGGAVTFYGKDWRASQQFSGAFSGSNDFQGWVDDDNGNKVLGAPGWCSLSWKHADKNDRPDKLPKYMGVLVSSSIAKTNGRWSGNIQGLVVVDTVKLSKKSGTGNIIAVQSTWHGSNGKCHVCRSCVDGQFQTASCTSAAQTQCAPCSGGCATCSGTATYCLSCTASGSFANGGVCQTCSQANPGCATCDSTGACTACSAGFTSDGNGGCSANTGCSGQPRCDGCPPTTSDGNGGCRDCTSCGSGFFYTCTPTADTTCGSCDTSCATCTGAGASDCTSCPSGYTLVGTTCQPNSAGTCNVPNCDTCNIGNPNFCQACAYGCTTNIDGTCGCSAAAVVAAAPEALSAATVKNTVIPVVLVPVGLGIIVASWIFCFRRRADVAQPKRSSQQKLTDGTSHGLKEEGVSPSVAVSINART